MRPRIDLDPYKDEIIGLFNQKYTTEIICALMKQRHSLDLSDGTLSRRLREWGLRRLPSKRVDDAALRERITSLVRDDLSDKEIVETLRREEAFSGLSQSKVSKTRRKMGLRLRTDDPQARQAQDAQIEEVIRQEIEKGEIEGYGRRLLHSHLRAKGHVFPRDRVFAAYCRQRPDSLRRRTLDLQRIQTEPEPAPEPVEDSTGPNHIWHMIGFMKMAEFGLEMYAAIDEYSRYVLWIYVGVPSRTAVSVYRQYLDAVSDSKHLPQIVRTNLHAETTLVGDAHWALRRASHPEVAQADCYSSGGSGGNSENNRRDSWWSQLSKSSVFIWRNYFATLQEQHLYSKTSIPDQVALLAVFMPTIRSSVNSYVKTWNRHKIRKQPKRPWVAHGAPLYLYEHSTKKNFRQPADPALLESLQRDAAIWDAEEYLPHDTLEWCTRELQQIGFDSCNPPPRDDFAQPYRGAYLELRRRAILHVQSRAAPILGVCELPTRENW